MPDAAGRPRSIRDALMDRCRAYPCTVRIALAGAAGTILLYVAHVAGHA